jgi:regulatory protein YycI of two-component signal transduction system YycFG
MASLSLKKIGFLTPLAVLILILVLVNVLLTLGNQFLRQQLNERQQVLSQSMQMEGLYREIVTTLATVAVKTNDPQIKGLLASQGINLDGDPKPGGGAK